MDHTDGFAGLHCLDCGGRFDDHHGRCQDCGGILDPTYREDALSSFHERLAEGEHHRSGGLARFAPALPIASERLVSLEEGATPLVECPTLAEGGVEGVRCKDEGRNPTGGLVDREMALAVTAAHEEGASAVALATTGNGGQAAAAYAARAGLDAHSFVPSRSTFATKAMINVHGGEMSVVGGRYPDASEAFADAIADEPWHSLAPFETPYRHEGAKSLAYELFASLGRAPDAVVHPTAHGTGLVGLAKGFRELARTDAVEREPRLYAVQPAGCAPLVDAWGADEHVHEPVEFPDTICGALEVPDPAGGRLVLEALERTGGEVVAVADDALLEGAVSLAGSGVALSAAGGAAVAGVEHLVEAGAFDADELVVFVNPATANRDADVLRSHLMKQGI